MSVLNASSGNPPPLDTASAIAQHLNSPLPEKLAARTLGHDLPAAFVPRALRRYFATSITTAAGLADRARSIATISLSATSSSPRGTDIASGTYALSTSVVEHYTPPFGVRALPRAFIPRALRRWLAPDPSTPKFSDFYGEFVPPGLTRYFASRARQGTDFASATVVHNVNVVETMTQRDSVTATWNFNLVAFEDGNAVTDTATSTRITPIAVTERAPFSYGRARDLSRMVPRGLEAWFQAPAIRPSDRATNILLMRGSGYEVAPGTVQPVFPRGFGLFDAPGAALLRSGQTVRRAEHFYSIFPRGFGLFDAPSRSWFHTRPPSAAAPARDFPKNTLRMLGIASDKNPVPRDSATFRAATVITGARETRAATTDTASAIFSLNNTVRDRGFYGNDIASITQFIPAIAYAPPVPTQQNAIPDALVTVYSPDMSVVHTMDATLTDFAGGGITYEDRPEGCGAATLDLGLYFAEVNNRGYWAAENIVEISTGDCVLTAPSSAGASKLYVDTNQPFNTILGEDLGQAYLRLTGSLFDARIPVLGIGTDTSGPYLAIGQPVNQSGVAYQLPAYPAGAIVGRRRYVGRIKMRTRSDTRDRKTKISLAGLAPTFKEANGTFTITAQDVGTSIYNCIALFADRWPFLNINAQYFPAIGALYSGTRDRSQLDGMISDILSAVTNGDVWVLRVGHDRTPRLLKLYTSIGDTYVYNLKLPSSTYEFAPIGLSVNDEDTSNVYNAVTVLGDTDDQTKQPVSALVLDTASIALYGRQIDAAPISNSACKTIGDCVRYGQTLLNQQSIASSNNGFRVGTRNDHRDLWNMPGGIRQGDVIRAVNNVAVTRIDTSGTGLNFVPDSEFLYVGAIWDTNGAFAREGVGYGGSDGVQMAADGQTRTLRLKEWVDVAPGSWWNLSAYIDAGSVQNGRPGIRLIDQASGVEVARVLQTAGIVSTVYSPIQIPDGVFRVIVEITNGASTTNLVPNNVTISRPQLSRGTTLSPYERNYASPPIYGLVASVTSTIQLGGADGLNRWQDVKFAAIEPDWSATIAEKTNAIATALAQNRATAAHLESYCVSPEAFPPSWNGLVIHVGAFAAKFGKDTSPKIVGNNYFMLYENETNWAWLNPDGSWTIEQDPTTVPGAILYALFQCDASGVIGYYPKASIGITGIGAAAVATTSFPAPQLDGDPYIVSASTPYPTDANIEITAKLKSIPAGAVTVVVLYREHVDVFNGQTLNAWIPDQEIALAGAPMAASPQVIDPTLGQMSKGRSYDFALQYRGTQTYGTISDPIGSAAIKQNGFVAQTLLVTSQYLIGGAATYVPIIANVEIDVQKSPDNINAAIQVTFSVTNQPIDHSISKIHLFAKSDNANNLSDCGALPAVGLGFDRPPTSGTYAFTAILPIGNGYTFYCAAEDIKGEFTQPDRAIIGTIDAQNVVLDPAQLSQKFKNILNSAFFGLDFADDGSLVIPYQTEVCPSQQPFTISLVNPASGNVDSGYDTTSAITFTMRARNGYGNGDPGRIGMVFFCDANPNVADYRNGFLVQSEPDGIGLYRKVGGNYQNIGYFAAPQALVKTATPLDGQWHEYKVIVSPVLRTDRYTQTFGSASGQSRSVIAGLLRFTVYFDGAYYCALDFQTGNTALTGYLGPRNSSPQPVYIDKADFNIRVGSSTTTYNELDPIVRGVIANPIDVAGDNRPSSLQPGTVGNYQTIPSNGNNILYNPSGSRNLAGWSKFGTRMTWESAGYYGGSIHGLYSGYAGRIDEVLQQYLTNTNNNGPIYTYTTYTASGRIHINSVNGTVAVDCIDGTNFLAGKQFTAPGEYSFEFTFTTKNIASLYFRLHFTGLSVDVYFFAMQLEPGSVATLFNDDATSGVSTITQLPGGGIDLANPYNANYNLDAIPTGATYGKLPGANISDGRAIIDFNAGHVNKVFDALYGTAKYSQLDPGSVGIALNSVGRVTGPGASVTSTGSTNPQSFVRAIVDEERSKNQTLTPQGTYSPDYGYLVGLYQLTIPASQDAAQWFVEFSWLVYGVNTNMTVFFGGPLSNVTQNNGQANAYYNVYQDYVPDDNTYVRAYKMFCGSSFTGVVSLAAGASTTITVQAWCDCSNELVTYMNGSQSLVRATKTQTRLEVGTYTLRASRFT